MSERSPSLAWLAGVVAAIGLVFGIAAGREDLAAWENDSPTVDLEEVTVHDLARTGLAGGSAAWQHVPGRGLAVAPGADTHLDVPFDAGRVDGAFVVLLDLAEPNDVQVRVVASLDGHRTDRVIHRGSADERSVVVASSLPEGSDPRLRLRIRRAADSTGVPEAVVRRVGVLTGHLPVLPALPVLLLPALLAVQILIVAHLRSGQVGPAVAGGVGAAVVSGLLVVKAPLLAAEPLGWASIGLGVVALPMVAGREERGRAAAACALLAILGWALAERWDLLTQILPAELEPDTSDYLGLARDLGSPYATGVREPFFVWVLWLARHALGSGHATPRLVSVLFSLAAIAMTYRLGARLLGRPVGLLAALLMAGAPFYIGQSVRGLRFELFVVEILAFLELVLLEHRSWRTDAATGALAAAILLTRLSSLGFLVLGLAVVAWRRPERSWRPLAVLFLPMFLLVAGHLVHNHRRTGDPLDTINRHIRYYRNREFAGAPGHPTWDEVEADPYGGEPITTFGYLFGMHGPRQLVAYGGEGLHRLLVGRYARETFFNGTRLRQLACLAGLLLLLLDRRGRLILAAVVVLLGPLPFLLGAGPAFDGRLFYHVGPFLEMAAAFALLAPLRALGPEAGGQDSRSFVSPRLRSTR